MMHIAPHSKARIMVGCNDVRHLYVSAQSLGKFNTTAYDNVGMVTAMCGIEAIVAWQNLTLDVCSNLLSNHSRLSHYHLNYFAALEVLACKVSNLLSSNIGYGRYALLRSAIICTAHDIFDCDICNTKWSIKDA